MEGKREEKKEKPKRKKGRKIGQRRERKRKIFLAFGQSKLDSLRINPSTQQELRVGTKIKEFRQTSRGREFFYFGYF